MKKLLMCLIPFVLAGCGEQNANTASDQPTKLVAAHNQTNMTSPYQTGMLKLKETAEKSNQFQVEVHAGTIGTNENELVEKLVLGGADVVLVSPGFMTSAGIDEVDLFSLLYLFNNYEHWEKVVDSDVGKKIADIIYEKSGNKYRVIGYWSAGVRHWYGKKPINTIADAKGLKIRTQTSGVVSDFWIKIGAVPTSVAWAELYQALASNVVDGAENAYPYLVPMEHHKTTNGKYISETAHDYTTRFLLMREATWKKLTDEQKATLETAVKEATQAERNAIYAEENQYKEKAIADGAVVNEVDKIQFSDIARSIQDDWANKHGMTEILNQIRQVK
ncbi:TRAP-type C4-dicarboxylate transport system substrate-binding protein [Cricetibacter osteomyelitidis]|uniref:TRAP-type C4-dicarboxylate transport system substrate-binding protein n=1 Tax=Cricetibacter osteomyelitidis TaxID=1521931 RepID=A0A4R2SZ23_9PAST|nr:TRAP transporter substrate-binding protein [Cricetibacter osteomyelitidis]TCP95799.1 TRAP-type C4-dicarboxylate transport system substrate-binding protein [Cricetibacter osteomyelitidis]